MGIWFDRSAEWPGRVPVSPAVASRYVAPSPCSRRQATRRVRIVQHREAMIICLPMKWLFVGANHCKRRDRGVNRLRSGTPFRGTLIFSINERISVKGGVPIGSDRDPTTSRFCYGYQFATSGLVRGSSSKPIYSRAPEGGRLIRSDALALRPRWAFLSVPASASGVRPYWPGRRRRPPGSQSAPG